MADINFPTFSEAKFSVTGIKPEDPGIVSNMENGLQTSRARFPKSRLTFKVNSKLNIDDFKIFMNFYQNIIKGSAQKFVWMDEDPQSPYYNQMFIVRMTSLSEPQKVMIKYWSVELTLQEV